jgi:hypothetical protein
MSPLQINLATTCLFNAAQTQTQDEREAKSQEKATGELVAYMDAHADCDEQRRLMLSHMSAQRESCEEQRRLMRERERLAREQQANRERWRRKGDLEKWLSSRSQSPPTSARAPLTDSGWRDRLGRTPIPGIDFLGPDESKCQHLENFEEALKLQQLADRNGTELFRTL